ncbi:MAG: PBP1A family penicillin-binding protein [Alphaproteobacteria bacterium]|nr:PBP1A family penicillin-binding protein [Alphaproteobacteria bacterium]
MARKAKTEPPRKSGAKKAAPKKAAAKGAVRLQRSMAGRVLRASVVAAIWVAVLGGALVAYYAYTLPDLEALDTPPRRPSVTMLDREGAVLATFGDLYGGPVGFDEVPPYLVQAIVATEDRRFFNHLGVDAFGILRALTANLRAGAVRQGGSTLTQQLAKNLFLTADRSLERKIQELLLAFWLERTFSKDEILAIYLNRVYLGAGAYGVEAASRRYFNRSARDLSLHQAAVLAGLLKAPSRYAPSRDPAAARDRARQVLASMVDAGFLSKADAEAAAAEPLGLRRTMGAGVRYFAEWLLERASGYVGPNGGDLVIRTTLSTRLQRLAEDRVEVRLKSEGARGGATQAALVALSPDGAVRAMVGGRSYGDSQFNRATQALRQPGSAFKLFVYLAALEAGMRPDDIVVDKPISIGGWRPRNNSGAYRGDITLARALAESVNTAAVRVAEAAGRDKVAAAARRLGIGSPLTKHPSLALGASEVTLLDLTAAYGVVANRGRAVWPYGIEEVRAADGKVLYRRSGSGGGRLVAEDTAAALGRMLEGVVAEGTGRAAALGRAAAGKTGTSQDFRDAWFIGYTPSLVAGVWVGNDDAKPMKRITGGGMPARLWRDFMLAASPGRTEAARDR